MNTDELKELIKQEKTQRINLRGNKIRKNTKNLETLNGRSVYIVDLAKDSEVRILDGYDVKFVGDHIICSGEAEFDGCYCESRPLGATGFIQTFAQEGEFCFHCKKHPNEKLMVIVE